MDVEAPVHKGDVQAAVQAAAFIHDIDKECGNRHLKQHFLQRGEPQVCLVPDLGEVIQEADDAEGQRHQIDIENGGVLHEGDVAQQADQRSGNEHDAAHHGGAHFVVMPGGPHLPDGLSGLQSPQHREQKMSENTGQPTADDGR